MKKNIKRLLAPLAWGGVGILLLVVLLRTADSEVWAGIWPAAEPETVEASFVTSQIPVCYGDSIWFINTSTADSGIAGVEWDFGDGVTSTAELAVEHVYARSGTYTVWLTATSTLGAQDAVSQSVSTEEVIAAIEPSGSVGICQYSTVTFENTSQVTGTVTGWEWAFSDGLTLDTPSAVRTFDVVEVYTLTLTVTTDAGCTDVAQTVITVLPAAAPQIEISAGPPDVGATVYFTDTGEVAPGQTWQWDFGDGQVTPPLSTPYASHAYQSGGIKNVVLTATAASGCVSVVEDSLWVREDVYLPVVMDNRVEIYTEVFDDGTTGWKTWKKKEEHENHYGGYLIERDTADLVANLDNVDPEMAEILAMDILAGEPEVYYTVVHDHWDEVFMGGPYKTKSGDFTYQVKARYVYAQKLYRGDEYGILVSEEDVDPADAHTVHGYSFQIRLNPNADAGWGVERWARTDWKGDMSGGRDSKWIKGPHTSTAIKTEIRKWNKIVFEREGEVFRVYVNDTLLGEDTDAKYTGPMYIGFFARHTGDTATELSYDMMFEWDDVRVESE